MDGRENGKSIAMKYDTIRYDTLPYSTVVYNKQMRYYTIHLANHHCPEKYIQFLARPVRASFA